MLSSIKIDRFKSVRDLDLSLGRVNLFIGGNGSGKSNLLEAIGVMAAALSRGVSESELARKGVRLTPAALMKSAFKNYDLPKTLRLSARFDNSTEYTIGLASGLAKRNLTFFTERGSYQGRKVFGRGRNGAKVLDKSIDRNLDNSRSIWDQTKSAFDFAEPFERALDMLSRYTIYAPQTEFLREIKSGLVVEPPIGLHGEGLSAAVHSLLLQFNRTRRQSEHDDSKDSADELRLISDALSIVWLPGWANSVNVGDIKSILKSPEMATQRGKIVYFIDKFMIENRNTLSAYDSSEGTLFLLFMSILLGHEESPKIFGVDNVDSALNPALTRKLVERTIELCKRKSGASLSRGPDQVFFTSHNPTSLDAFDLFDDEQRVFVVARDAKGQTTATRLRPNDGWTREDWSKTFKDKKLSQLWIDGEIKGALGSYGSGL